ncbi:MAG TPA: CoA-binding protein, partial [Burkholderiaceae bacterium]|nr:CoA-binding protein [Burkholderiaceae bacterium]
MRRHRLSPLFEPESVALFGATEREGAVGRFIYENLLASGYAGRIGLVNPKHRTLFGQPVAANAAKLPFAPELAIVAAPAHAVESIVAECAARGTRFVLVLSAGFAESGAAGRALQESLLATSRRLGVRLLGPNCLGLIRPSIGLNASFAVGKVKDGRVALVSQSGALVTAMIDWAIPAGIGFSSLVSLGSAIDLDFGELLDWFLFDDRTDSVLMYIEGVRDARSFMSSVRALARVKPVVIMKAGRTADTADRGGVARAIASHSGALTGNDRVFDAAIARATPPRSAVSAVRPAFMMTT